MTFISDILGFLKVEHTIRGDVQYSPSLSLSNVDLTANRPVSDEEFHKAAIEYEANKKANQYAVQRRKAYPRVTDQLDMIWHAMDGGLIPKAEAFFNAIKAIKDQFPK